MPADPSTRDRQRRRQARAAGDARPVTQVPTSDLHLLLTLLDDLDATEVMNPDELAARDRAWDALLET